MANLNAQFASRSIDKEYIAILAGNASRALEECSRHNCSDIESSLSSENNISVSKIEKSSSLQLASIELISPSEEPVELSSSAVIFNISAPVNALTASSTMEVLEVVGCNVYGAMSKVKLSPQEGRRHQLRQHCALIGCPILGDDLYHNYSAYSDMYTRATMLQAASEGNTITLPSFSSSSVKTPPLKAFAPVRERGGLFLMSTAISFSHPTTGKLTRIECPLSNKFRNVIFRARKGAEWNALRLQEQSEKGITSSTS